MASTTPPTSIDISENMEDKVLNILADTYPNLDCGPGTPIYEMVVRPIAILWSRQATGINELTKSLDLTNYVNLQDDDIDRLVSRYFVERNEGSYVTGYVRVMFADPLSVYIYAGDIFEADNERTYEVISSHNITASNLSGDSTNGYYVDIAVQSTDTGSMYNASANEAVTVTGGAEQYYTRAYFVEDTSSGGMVDTNASVFQRAKNLLAVRGLYSYKSVGSAIISNFINIQEVTPIGIRDDEMVRDLVLIMGRGTCHIGGKCDIYVKPSTYRVYSGYQAPLGFPMTYTDTQGVEYSVTNDPDGLMEAWNKLELSVTDYGYRGSTQEDIPLLSEGTTMSTLSAEATEISDLDNFIDDNSNELLHTDNVIKQKWPIVVYVNVKIYSDYAEDAITTAKATIVDYINGLETSEAPSSTEIIYLLRSAGIEKVRLPLDMYAYYITDDTLDMQYIGLNGEHSEGSLLTPVEDDSLKFEINARSQISLKTCCWYTNSDLINIEVEA